MTYHPPYWKRRAACARLHSSFQRQTARARARAFSLVEVTLAVGIMGFAFVSILGLMPVGLTNFRQTKNISAASQIAQQIFAEVQNTTFAQLTGGLSPGNSLRLPPPGGQTQSNPGNPPPTTVPLRYFDDQGQELSSADPATVALAVYQVNVRVVVSTPFVQTAATPTPNPALATVTIQIAYNPGNLPMDTGSDLVLWTGTSKGINVPMFTYETLVARNF